MSSSNGLEALQYSNGSNKGNGSGTLDAVAVNLGITSRQELEEKGVLLIPVGEPKFEYCARCIIEGWPEEIPLFVPYGLGVSGDKVVEVKNLDSKQFACILFDLHDDAWRWSEDIPKTILFSDKSLFISNADSCVDFEVEKIVACHFNDNHRYVGARYPWAFGLSREMESFSRNEKTNVSREWVISRRFRNSFNQDVRNLLDLSLIPRLEKYFYLRDKEIGHDRWELGYWNHLLSSYACLCYGGCLRTNRRLFGTVHGAALRAGVAIIRWDSWRLWESLMTATPAVMLDMDYYCLRLPVQPKAFEHYIPVRLDDPARVVKFLVECPNEVAKIGRQGRQFALEHYSPSASATRLLDWIV